MNKYELSFAKIIIVREDIAEVIVDDGVELDIGMVDEYHDFLVAHMRPPFAVLINKINSYTYSFEAQRKIGSLKELNAIAVVTYNWLAKASTDVLVNSIPREKTWNTDMFPSREEALAWLIEEQQKVGLCEK